MLLITSIVAGITIYTGYTSRPGLIQTVEAMDRKTDSLTLKWTPARNAERYVISRRGAEDVTVPGDQSSLTVSGLEEGRSYSFEVKAVREDNESNVLKIKADTKRSQSIEGKQDQMKLSSMESLDLGLSAETDIRYTVEGETTDDLNLNESGTISVKAEAVEDENYIQSEEYEVNVEVLDSVSDDPSSSSIHELYYLDKNNCELVEKIRGADGAKVPQSFGYDNGTYHIAYGMYDKQRIVTYSPDGEFVTTPKIKLGHPNGFTVADGTFYCVKGFGGRCVTYNQEDDKWDIINLPVGASGIAYDRLAERFYTASKTGHTVYDKDLNVIGSIPVVPHKGGYHTQDCGGHSGIMLHCISDSTKHGINYVDLYDAVHSKYLGSIKCNLGEVESAIVNNDGFLELLCNTKKEEDYIYRTPVNIEDLGREILLSIEQESPPEEA